MQDLLVVAMLNSEGDLSEPIKEHILGHVVLAALPIGRLESLLDLHLQITIVCIVHHDTELAFLGLVYLTEAGNVYVVEDLQDFCLVQRLTALFLAHLCNVNLLDHRQCVVRKALHEIGSSKGTGT